MKQNKSSKQNKTGNTRKKVLSLKRLCITGPALNLYLEYDILELLFDKKIDECLDDIEDMMTECLDDIQDYIQERAFRRSKPQDK